MAPTAELATEARRHRRALHLAVARGDVQGMRAAMHDLYVHETSPLRRMDEAVKRVETYAPVVEAAILARALAPNTPLCRETALNLEHTHAKFGIPPGDYDTVVAQLDEPDPRSVDWCVGTCLHGRVKPWRHEAMFASASSRLNSSSHEDAQ